MIVVDLDAFFFCCSFTSFPFPFPFPFPFQFQLRTISGKNCGANFFFELLSLSNIVKVKLVFSFVPPTQSVAPPVSSSLLSQTFSNPLKNCSNTLLPLHPDILSHHVTTENVNKNIYLSAAYTTVPVGQIRTLQRVPNIILYLIPVEAKHIVNAVVTGVPS